MTPLGLFRVVDAGGERALGIDMGIGKEQFARSGLARLLVETGRRWGPDGAPSAWKPEGIAEIDGRIFIHGPFFSGTPLLDLMSDDSEKAWQEVVRIARNSAGEAEPSPIVPASILVGDDGSLLIVPERIAVRALEASEAFLDGAFRWLNPALGGTEAAAFTLASLFYRLLSGSAPFDGSTKDEVAADIRDAAFLPLRFAAPGVDPDIARATDAALGSGGKEEKRPTLRDWAAIATRTESLSPRDGGRSALRTVSDSELKRIRDEGETYRIKRNARLARMRFFRANGKRAAFIGAAILGVALATWSVFSGKPPRFDTKGLSPQEVVSTFYAAYNDLDVDKMQDCAISGAAKNDINAATNLYVVFRVRSAYEKDGGYISAAKWIAEGSPPTSKAIFGLVDPQFEKTAAEDTLIARYRFYGPGQNPEKREDRVSLTLKDGRWKIRHVERRILP